MPVAGTLCGQWRSPQILQERPAVQVSCCGCKDGLLINMLVIPPLSFRIAKGYYCPL